MIFNSCRVALPIPSDKLYSYSVPKTLGNRVVEGARVVVSVRSRMHIGIVVEGSDEDPGGLKPVLLAPDPAPLVPSSLVELARWMSKYYYTPFGMVLKTMLPGTLWGSSRVLVRATGNGSVGGGTSARILNLINSYRGPVVAGALARKAGRPIWDTLQRLEATGAVVLETEPPRTGPAPGAEKWIVLEDGLETLLDRDRMFGRARAQRRAFETLENLGGQAPAVQLRERHGVSAPVVRQLVKKGLARVELRERLRDPFETLEGTPPPVPDEIQRGAIEEMDEVEPGGAVTLFGITGSGKTLVYLEVVRKAIERGRGAIVLVPEIALTPQTIARVRGAFGGDVAVLHSALSDGERADAWRGLASGKKRVAVGARSAVFAPIPKLGVIVVDEEHDSSYKNGESPRYHARDVAIRRGRIEGAITILSSATPSLEAWAARDRVGVVRLPRRVGGRALPSVRLVDLRSSVPIRKAAPVPWSSELDSAVERRLERGEQSILLLNRRGFAHFQQCTSCGEAAGCPHCSIALTVHENPNRLFCHYCGFVAELTDTCAACGNTKQVYRGVGTQQLERWLASRFHGARLARMDADTTSSRWSHHRILDEVGKGNIDILFGTQMIAKGLDFPGVTLVGVVDADTGLNLPDFRAAERTFQLVAQVAGRAGRGEKSGEVLVQTRNPEHYALVQAAAHDYEAFAATELSKRDEPAYPPVVSLVNVVLSGTVEAQVGNGAASLGEWFRGLVADRLDNRVEVLGPAPCPLARIKTRWRWHLLLRAHNPRDLGRLGRYASARAGKVVGKGVRVIFDRDPTSLL